MYKNQFYLIKSISAFLNLKNSNIGFLGVQDNTKNFIIFNKFAMI